MAQIASEALNGLYDAKLDHVPVLAITGMQETSLLGATMAPGLPYAIGIQHAFPGRQVIAFADYGAFATANGALGAKVTAPGEVRPAIQRALNHPGPALVDVNVNPAEPPLPGKVEYEQAKKFALAFLRGQPHRATIATTLLKDKIQEFHS